MKGRKTYWSKLRTHPYSDSKGGKKIPNDILHTHQNPLLTLAEWESRILQACHRAGFTVSVLILIVTLLWKGDKNGKY